MKRQLGLTLVEMMISMALSLVLLLGVLQIMQSTKDNNRTQDELARLQERGRFAIEILSRDIRMAAFYGCLGDGTQITNHIDLANTTLDDLMEFDTGIDGTEGGGDAPDQLFLRGAYGGGLNIETPYMVQASGNVKVESNTILAGGSFVVVCDYEQGDAFQISNNNPGTGTVVHNTGNSQTPGNINAATSSCTGGANPHCLSKVYEEDAMLFQVQGIIYKIDTGSNGQPALFRQTTAMTSAIELVEGIENLQVLYGEDQDGNKTADRYVTASDATLSMSNVVSIRFQLLARTLEDNIADVKQVYRFNGSDQTATDNRIRRVFSGTVVIRNRAS